MTQQEFNNLIRGNLVVSKSSGNCYIIDITLNYESKRSYIGVDTIQITNPDEWNLVPIESKSEINRLLNENLLLKEKLQRVNYLISQG